CDRCLDRSSGLRDVEWVDQQRLEQLPRRPRKRAQYQHAILVIACRREFLRNEVHAVMQAVHDAEVRRAIQFPYRVGRLLGVDQHYGLPGFGSEPGIDPLQLRGCLFLKQTVRGKLAPRRSRNLQKRHLAAKVRPRVQKQLDRVEPLDDSFGEVPAFGAEAEGNIVTDAVAMPHIDTCETDWR